jgi:hypothetical protein
MHRPTALLVSLSAAALFLPLASAAETPTTRPTVAAVGGRESAPATGPATAPAAARTPAGGLARFPTFGVAFALPAGWAEVPREKAGRVGQWIGPDSTPAALKQLVMVETGRPGGTSAEAMAKGLARNFGGVVMDAPTTLGGDPALLVRAENNDDELAPVIGLVCIHGDNVFLVMGGTVKGKDVAPAVEAIRASWRWTPVEKPAAHLAFRDRPFAAFDGTVSLNVPAMMHAVAADDPDTQLDLAMFNLARNNADFRATMTLTPLAQGETFEQAKGRFLAELGEKYKFHQPPAWAERPAGGGGDRDVGGKRPNGGEGGAGHGADLPRLLTPPVEADRPQPAVTETLHHQWAAVPLGEHADRVLLMHFTHEAETDEERHAYEQAVGRIVDSVTSVPKTK